MKLSMDLKKYCTGAVLEKGRGLADAKGVKYPGFTMEADGAGMLKGKVVDSFNFVSRPWLKVDASGHQLLDFGCDCPDMRSRKVVCEHCVALCLDWSGEIILPDAPVAEMPAVQNPVIVETPAEPELVVVPEIPAEAVEPEAPADVAEPEIPAETAEPEVPAEPQPHRSMQIHLGQDADGAPIIWYPNDTDRTFHTNIGILGTMGTGKTQFAKSLLTQMYQQQPNNYDGHNLGILIFDYKGDYNETKKDFVQATKARVFKPYRLPYNPLALHPGASFKPLLPMHTANEFKDTISQIYGLGPKQEHLLLECIIKAYRKQGIDPADPSTWGRRAPTVDQVYDILAAETEGKPVDKLTTAMAKLHQFCIFENRPECAVSLDTLLDGVVVIDMAGYDSDIQSTIVAITLNQFYARMQAQGSSPTDGKFRQLRKFIMVDEADTFMREDFPSLRRILKEGREFGVGMILSTQSLDHYTAEEDNYSRYVLTWIIHNVGDLKQREVEYLFKLPPKSTEIARLYGAIKGLQKHESIVKLGNETPQQMRNLAFYELFQQMQA